MSKATGNMAMAELMMLHRRLNGKSIIASEYQAGLLKKKEWEALNLPVKAVVPDEGVPYYRVNLRKKSIKEDGDSSSPVSVVDGKLNPIDPDSIGNGSIGNIRVFQYEYSNAGKKGTASVLMGMQLTKHIVYTPQARDDDFEETDTETVSSEQSEYSEDF